MIHVKEGKNASVICNYTRDFTYYLKDSLTYNYSDPDFMKEFESFWTLYDDDMEIAAFQLVTKDEKAMIINIGGGQKTSVASRKFVNYLLDLLANFTRDHPDDRFEIERTGDDIIMDDFYALSISEMVITDSISASISLIVMLLLLRSLVLMIIPFFNLICSLLCSLGALYAIAINAKVGTFVPAIVLAVLIAMTIDYSLFMLVRFRKELDQLSPHGEPISREDYEEAVHTTVCFAGHVIAISGSTLAIAFAGICLLHIELLVTLGFSTALSLFFTIIVNLTLGPSLLLCFPRLFCKPGIIPCSPQLLTEENCCSCCKKSDVDDNDAGLYSEKSLPVNSAEKGETSPLISGDAEDYTLNEKQMKKIVNSGWYRVAEILTGREGSCIVFLLVIAALLPIMFSVRWFTYSDSNALVFTNDLPAMKTLNDMESFFPPGMLYPFYLGAVPKNSSINGTFTKEYFDFVPEVVKKVKNATKNGIDDDGFLSTAFSYGSEVDFDTASSFVDPGSIMYNTSFAKMYRMLADRVLSKDHNASLIIMMVNFNPNNGPSDEWVNAVRDIVIPDLNAHSQWDWFLSSVFVDELDVMVKSFEMFPMMIVITVAVIVVFVSVAFRSFILPLRLVFSLGLTVVWTYGAASLVFCLDTFDFIPALKDVDSLYFLICLIVLTIIIGLGIDYDVFLFSRITEERQHGYSADEAIRLGYYHTGGVITGAGVVMSIAFSGLLISKQHILQQLGFFLSISVLLDTFIVRMLLVPTILHLFGNMNWWPRKLPPPSLPDLRTSLANSQSGKNDVTH